MQAARLAILNGFGISLGDSVIGLQALYAAQAMGGFPRPLLVRRAGRAMVAQIYTLAADFADLHVLPGDWPEEIGQGDARVIDLRDFAFDPGFRGVAMIDFFLGRLGLDPAGVPASLRRNSWVAPRARPSTPPEVPKHYILLCPSSSMALRDMPASVQARILALVLARQTLPVVTQGAVPGWAGDRVIAMPLFARLEQLLGLVAGARAVISTDTAMVHLADAFAVPCLAFFTTHRPEWRMRDYPLCRAVHLPPRGLPEALEFSQGPEDLAAVARAWREGMGAIDAGVADFVEGSPC